MQQSLFIAVIAGLGGMLGWGFADFFAKKTIDEIGDIVSLFWAHIFGTTFFALIVLFQIVFSHRYTIFPTSSVSWILVALFGALQAVVYFLTYKGFGKGQLAILNPVFASYSGVVALVSILFFGELITLFKAASLIILFVGIICLSLDFSGIASKRINFHRIPGLREVGGAAVLAAVWTLGWDRFIGGKDWVLYAFYMYAFMTITVFCIATQQKAKLSTVKPHLWKFLIFIGLGETIAYLAISLGFSVTPYTSVVALLSGAFSLPTIILARMFLKEKVATVQTIGSVIIIIGIILLSIH